MIKTKAVKDPIKQSDGERILVTRYPARKKGGHKILLIKEWMKDLSPSPDLLNDWKHGKISWPEYKISYHKEMSSQKDKILDLAKRAKRRTITLLCFESEDDPNCHRHLLKKLIERQMKKNSG